METTLGALLARRSLDLRQVAGPVDPERRVRWVAVSELADPTPYLEGGELLLTTGLALAPDDGDAVEDYVEQLQRRGVVALGVGTGVRHEVVPPALVAAAERAGLPLLDVPPPTPFIAVTRAVADLVAQAEREDITRSLDAQRRLTRAALHGPDGVVRELARLVGGWALVTDARGAVTHGAGERPSDAAGLVAAEVTRLAPQGLRGASSISSSDGALVVQPLGVSGAPLGYLAVGHRSSAARPVRGAVSAAVSLLSLALQRSDAADSERRRVLRAAADLLVRGRTEAADALLAALGSALSDDVVVLVAQGDPEGPGPGLPDGTLRTEEGHDVVVLAPAAAVGASVGALRGPAPVGLSRPVGRAEIPRGVAEARAARATAAAPTDVVAFADVLAAGVPALVDEAGARTWSEELLAPLGRDEELLRSLRTWLTHHGQLQPAAAELGVHRHTLRHRLTRVEELLGRPLTSPQTRMDLWFALQRR